MKTNKQARVCCLHEETKILRLLLQGSFVLFGGFFLRCLGLNDLARDKKRERRRSRQRKRQIVVVRLFVKLDWKKKEEERGEEREEREEGREERGERRDQSVCSCAIQMRNWSLVKVCIWFLML